MPLKLKRSFLKLRNTLLENDDPESLVRKTLLDFSENTFWQANAPFFFVRFPNVILAVTIFWGEIFLGSFRNLHSMRVFLSTKVLSPYVVTSLAALLQEAQPLRWLLGGQIPWHNGCFAPFLRVETPALYRPPPN